ncbi:hypothetical protein E2C01_102362 [Portunus trituberculatus]|uniref:Uncharacterized protein n=1 Tax=Portunus trituberculatus TaxID=210409 RepID=A0A5B7KI96_PORTR|nr:hypothetical protein [Portunus trituberculatus]
MEACGGPQWVLRGGDKSFAGPPPSNLHIRSRRDPHSERGRGDGGARGDGEAGHKGSSEERKAKPNMISVPFLPST